MSEVTELTAAVSNLIRTMQSTGNMGAGSDVFKEFNKNIGTSIKQQASQQALDLKGQKAIAELNSGLKGVLTSQKSQVAAFGKDLEVHAQLTGKLFEQSLQTLSGEHLELIPEAFNKNLSELTKKQLTDNEREIKSVGDVIRMKFEHDLKAANLDRFRAYTEAAETNSESMEEVANELDKLGFTSGDLKLSFEEMKTQVRDVGDALERTSHQAGGGGFGEFLGKAGKIGGYLIGLGAGALTVANAFRHVASSAARTGTQFETLDAVLMGMSPEELNQLQADHRQTINSLNISYDDFNDSVREGSLGLWQYTGSLRDAVRVQADAMSLAKLMGADIRSFADDQIDVFKRMNNAFSVTAENFMEMNKQLTDSHDVRSQLFRLDVKQRAAYFKNLQNTYEQLRVDGLVHEQALKMLEVFAQIGAKSPRERLKEAAKLQAVMGAMGMGQMGAEAGGLMRGGLRGEGDQKRFADIMKQANINVGERMGQGFASEMMTVQMIQTAGLSDYLGPDSKFAEFNTQQTMGIDQNNVLAERRNETLGQLHVDMGGMFGRLDQINAALSNPIFIAATGAFAGMIATMKDAVLAMLAGQALGSAGKVKNLFKSFTKGAGPVLEGIRNFLGKGGGPGMGGLIGKLGAMGFATVAVLDAVKAIQTGESTSHDLLTSTEVGESISHAIGSGIAWAMDKLGNDEAAMARDYYAKEDSRSKMEEDRELMKVSREQEQVDVMKDVKRELEETRKQAKELSDKEVAATQKTSKAVNESSDLQKRLAEDAKADADRKGRQAWMQIPRVTSAN